MSKLRDEVDLLRSIPVLATLPANKLKLLAFASDRVCWAAGETLFKQGDDADAAYIVIAGEADVLVSAESGGEPSKVAELGPNAFVGDMAILSDIQRTATIRAASQLDTLRIRKDHLIDMMKDSPALSMAVLQDLVQRLAKTTHDLTEARDEIAKLKAAS
ncbi:cyclic nucleotide-binding domain-containing protein [Rhizobiaceae bacterium]|nr:cyclic nucleotide-binding domain-containing protein [Rhizobiaceae bacterium]